MPPFESQLAPRPPVRVRILSVLNDIQVMLGLVGFSYGFWLAWRPLGFIVGGVALFALGILFGRSITDVRRRS